ncbi:hypothetical protein CL614_00645 [archaeon]|nr:hypothetical protein [archaeon]
MVLKFAHISDCHIGCWHNHPELEDKPLKAFERAINLSISKEVDIILIAGDLFDTNLPPIDDVTMTVKLLKKARDSGIEIFIVAGSHDFSPSGKTMISVLEGAGLVKNVAKFEENDEVILELTETDKIVIAGMMGKRAGLESELFKKIKPIELTEEQKNKFRIFMFHSAIEEYKPEHLKEMHALPIYDIPKGFDYYATGHVHHTFEMKEDGLGAVIFPGALFPCNFQELEKNKVGGFYLVEVSDNKELKIDWQEIKLIDVVDFKFDADNKSSTEVEKEIKETIEEKMKDTENSLVLVRIKGTLETGKPSDIRLDDILEKTGAIGLKKNTSALKTKEFEELDTDENISDIDELEDKIISEHLGQISAFGKKEKTIVKELISALKEDKGEETSAIYNERISENAKKILGLN